MRYESTMMMAGPTTIATHQPTGVAPSQLQRQSSSSHIYQLQTSPSRPSLAHQYSSSSSSSQQHPSRSSHHRSSRRGSHQHQQPLTVQQAQPQFLFYPQIVPYHQMPYHQQLPYQHQRMHNLLHGGNGGANFVPPYNNPYLAQSVSQTNLNLAQVQPGLSHSQSRRLSSSRSRNHLHAHTHTHAHAHAHRRHLLPNAPPSSQQHSSSSSFSSQQQLQQAAVQNQKASQSQTQNQKAKAPKAKAPSVQPPQSTSTNMPLFSGFSLRSKRRKEELAAKEPFMVQVKHLEKAAVPASSKTAPNTAKTQAAPPKMAPSSTRTQKQTQTSASMIKPPARDKADPPGRNRGAVDAQDLTKRLNNVLAERERREAVSVSTTPPRIKSRGSGNLRAAYASNGTSPVLRRQPFSAPHNLAGMAPPIEAPAKGRTRSLSPESSQALQQASMRGGGGSKTKAESSTLAQKRAVTSVIPPTNAQHGVPYVPSQAAQQFARTTVVVGGPRKPILLQKPRQGSASGGPGQSQPYSHNQMARSPTPADDKNDKDKAKSSASSAKSPTGPSVQHAFKDTLAEPGSRRQSMREGEPTEGAAEGAEVVPEMAVDVDESGDADVSASGDDDAKSKSSKSAKKPLVPQSDFRRIVQEHSVDWTQSDETSNQRKREKKEQKEREKREKREKKEKEKEKAKQEEEKQEPKGESGGRPLWRLKARLSSFSKDKQAPSPPAAVPVVEEKAENEMVAAEAKAEAAPEEPLEAPPAIVADTAEPTSHSSSVLSLTNLAKSSSFLSRFKH